MSDALLPLKRYFEFTGRSRRREFWLWSLFSFVVSIALGLIVIVSEALLGFDLSNSSSISADSYAPVLPSDWLNIFLFLATIIPNISLSVRRLHDTNRSVKWFFLLILPFIGIIGFTVLMCLKGTRGTNRFGPDPKS